MSQNLERSHLLAGHDLTLSLADAAKKYIKHLLYRQSGSVIREWKHSLAQNPNIQSLALTSIMENSNLRFWARFSSADFCQKGINIISIEHKSGDVIRHPLVRHFDKNRVMLPDYAKRELTGFVPYSPDWLNSNDGGSILNSN
jgi:hypothetical protein